MKKLLTFVFLLSVSVCAFSLESVTDVFLGGFYNYSNVFKGSAEYEKSINYNTEYFDGDYRAIFKAAGVSVGCDCFFNNFPFGLYFRVGYMGVQGVDRTAGGQSVSLDNTEVNFNVFTDIGGVYSFALGDYFSICAAPALSMLLVNSETRKNLYSYSSARATEDSLLGVGFTADLYAKFRYKFFVASAGCAASFYPLTLVSSADSSINYSTNIRDTMAYNLRPYISLGISIRERSGSTFGAGGN